MAAVASMDNIINLFRQLRGLDEMTQEQQERVNDLLLILIGKLTYEREL